ncbi:MAG: outer membrane beta-barrel protein [Saprospiraceae bacterium]|nr:outer membrane beta-barrel protein [Saprospiraceae bacterium]
MKPINLFILIVFLLQFVSLKSQNSRFNAGIVAGLNFSELEGNSITDYFGLNAGLIGTARIAKHAQIGIEFLFSQNGEYVLPSFYPKLQYGQIWLNHIEIPVHFDWLIGVFKKDKFYDLNLNLGIAYTRLIGYTANDNEGLEITDQIIYNYREAYLIQAGTTYNFTPKIALNLKASLPIRKEELSWTLGARLIYMVR